jgi:hypothetical protein
VPPIRRGMFNLCLTITHVVLSSLLSVPHQFWTIALRNRDSYKVLLCESDDNGRKKALQVLWRTSSKQC